MGPEFLLSEKKINGMVLLCFESERPLQGMLGELDWRFNGYFSNLLRNQILTGNQDEIFYTPLLWNQQTFHFLLIGGGDGDRAPGTSKQLELARAKMKELQLTRLGVSKNDFSKRGSSEDLSALESEDLWILN